MKLITPKLVTRFKEVGDQSEVENPLVIAKFFDPTGSATWYATEYYPERNSCFGYVKDLLPHEQGWFDEWGTFSIDELEALKRPFGLTVERDIYFNEIPFNELMQKNKLHELKKDKSPMEANQEPEH